LGPRPEGDPHLSAASASDLVLRRAPDLGEAQGRARDDARRPARGAAQADRGGDRGVDRARAAAPGRQAGSRSARGAGRRGRREVLRGDPRGAGARPGRGRERRRRTGDIGELDEDGYVRLVDRKKEIIINAAGKNMSPANIEAAIKTASPLIGQAITIGDRRPYNTALIVLDADFAPQWAKQQELE